MVALIRQSDVYARRRYTFDAIDFGPVQTYLYLLTRKFFVCIRIDLQSHMSRSVVYALYKYIGRAE